MRLDGFAEQQTQQHCREKTDGNVHGKALRLFLVGQLAQSGADLVPINQDDRKNRPSLDRNLKHFGFVIVKTQEAARENQMPG